MARDDTVRPATARSRLNQAEQLMEQGENVKAITEAFDAVAWAVGQVDAAEPIRTTRGMSKVDTLLQRLRQSHLSYTNSFKPLIGVLVSVAGTENIVIRGQVDGETAYQVLTRCAQIVARIEH